MSGKVRAMIVVPVVIAALLAVSVSGASAGTRAPQAPTAESRAAGSWTWWGYRTNSYETWAIATQSPSFVRGLIPRFAAYVYVQAWVWRLTAQNARMMGQCLGITWSGSGLIVGCAHY